MNSPTVLVVYLLAYAVPDYQLKARKFLSMYDEFDSGYDHNLCIIHKSGNHEMNLFSMFSHTSYFHDNYGLDIGSYKKVVEETNYDYYLFIGTHTYPNGNHWLLKLVEAAVRYTNLGVLGPVGSFEIENKGLTEADLFVNLYNFLGEITEISLPVRQDIEATKGINADFFEKIKKYIEENTVKKIDPKEANQEPKKQEPIPFMLVNDIGIKGLEDGLKALAQNNKKADGPKFPHKLPAGTKWENITIKFEDDNKVFIKAKQLEHYTDYKDMGFIGKGNNPEPSEAWVFLRVLSMAKITGEIAITDKEVRDKWKAQKGILGESLQNYFSIDYDPFYPYNSSTEKIGKSYKIKLTLIPPEPKTPEDET